MAFFLKIKEKGLVLMHILKKVFATTSKKYPGMLYTLGNLKKTFSYDLKKSITIHFLDIYDSDQISL